MTEARLRAAIAVLALAGLGIASYLVYARYAHVRISCATGGCETVQQSSYSELLGVPVAVLGLVGYVVVGGTAAFADDLARALGAVAAIVGLAFALYLLWAQIGPIGAFCQWCLASDAIITLLVPLTLLRLRELSDEPVRGARASRSV